MNWRYLVVLGTASLLLPIGGAIAVSQRDNSVAPQGSECSPPRPSMGRPPQGGNAGTPEPLWARGLNLSNEQRERLQAVHEQVMQETEDLQAQLREADQEMRSLLSSDASTEELKKQHEQVVALRHQLDDKHFDAMLAEREILTKEQRTQMNKFMQRNRPPLPPQ